MELPTKRNSIAGVHGVGDDLEPNEFNKLHNSGNGDHCEIRINPRSNEDVLDKTQTHTPTLQERWTSAKSFISANYRLIIIILFALVLLLFVSVIVLTAILSSRSIVTFPMKCESSTCLRSALSLVSNLDVGHDMCEDFWSFSCGGWIKKYPIPEEQALFNVKTQIKYETNLKLFKILHTKSDESSDAFTIVKKLYDACMDVNKINTDSERFRSDFIESKLGGWTFINGRNKLGKDRLLEDLHLYWGVNPFFKVLVERNDYDPTAPTIKIAPAEVGLPSKDHYFNPKYYKIQEAYKKFIVSTLLQLEAKPDEARTSAEHIFGLEGKIAGGLDDSLNASIPWKDVRISELDGMVPSIKWLDLIEKYSINTPVRQKTKLLLINEEYFRQLSRTLASSTEDLMMDYMVWRFVNHYLNYLSDKYRINYIEFQRVLNGVNRYGKLHEERWEFCIETVKKVYGLAATSLLFESENVMNNLKYNHQINSAERLVDLVKNKLVERLSDLKWITDSQTLNNFREKIRDMKVLVGHPENFPDVKAVDQIYKEAVTDNRLVHAVSHGYRFAAEGLSKKLSSYKPNSEWPIFVFDPEIHYEYAGNELYIGAGVLDSLIFNADNPDVVNYGSFGFHLISAMLKAIDSKGIYYDTMGRLMLLNGVVDAPIASSTSLNAFNASTNCLIRDISRMNASFENEFNVDLVVPGALNDIDALSIALDAYHDAVIRKGEEYSLPGIPLNNKQLFFVSFAQSMCEATRPAYESNINGVLRSLPPRYRVQTITQNMPKFSESFNCHQHPREPCYIY